MKNVVGLQLIISHHVTKEEHLSVLGRRFQKLQRDVPWDRNSARQEKGEENPLFQFLPATQYYDLKKMFRNIVKIIHVTKVIAGSLAQ